MMLIDLTILGALGLRYCSGQFEIVQTLLDYTHSFILYVLFDVNSVTLGVLHSPIELYGTSATVMSIGTKDMIRNRSSL